MKFVSSKCIQKAEGRKKGKYILTLSVSDYDLEMLEDLATTYAPFQLYDDNKNKLNFDLSPCEFNNKYRKWVMKMWKVFWKLWNKHHSF